MSHLIYTRLLLEFSLLLGVLMIFEVFIVVGILPIVRFLMIIGVLMIVAHPISLSASYRRLFCHISHIYVPRIRLI